MHNVSFEPFTGGDEWKSLKCDGADIGMLFVSSQRWQCRDGNLSFSVLAEQAVDIPEAEASEPMAAALARIGRHLQAQQAHLIIEDLAALPEDFYQHLSGCRFLRLQSADDLPIWDKLLSLGLPIFGLSDQLMCLSLSPQVGSAFQSILFGSFYCHNALCLDMDEGPHHCKVTVQTTDACQTRVIVRGGYELQQLSGAAIDWTDSGQEGYVRFEIQAGAHWAWTQPRFVAAPQEPLLP